MSDSQMAALTLDGWYILHQFFRVARGSEGDAPERRERAAHLAGRFAEWEDMGEDGWSGLYRLVGGGSDCMVIHFRSTLDALGEVEREIRLLDAARDLVPTGEYVSVVELGLYTVTAALVERARAEGIEPRSEEWQRMVEEALELERDKAYVQRRLMPRQPEEMPYVSFYPMDKRRSPDQNWYALPVEERARMMHDHGKTGRTYAGKVSQVISGSVGLDDWEWAVTLFSGDPLHFKELVTEMRYDEVSAVYSDFGSFWVGHRIPTDRIEEELAGGPA